MPATDTDTETDSEEDTEVSASLFGSPNVSGNPTSALRAACIRLLRLLAVGVGVSGVSSGNRVQAEARRNLASLMRNIVCKNL